MVNTMARSSRIISLALFLEILQAVSARSPIALLGKSSPVATPNEIPHAVSARSPIALLGRATPVAIANGAIGPGGTNWVDSGRFRFYDAPSDKVQQAINLVEGALQCFVEIYGWRNPNLSVNDFTDEDGPWTSINIFTVGDLGGANGGVVAGVQKSDADTGMGYLEILGDYLTDPDVIVHEFGHVMHYHQRTWVGQGNTGAWWEPVANWVSDTFMTSGLCSDARTKFGVEEATRTMFDPVKVIGDSFQVIVDATAGSGNYYQSWPFLTYITNNPDGFTGLGPDTLHQMMVQYDAGSNETPLHVLDRVATDNTAAQIVGRYWARMAYVDIWHTQAQATFFDARDAGSINYANVDNTGYETYKVKADRQPRYMGANIIPLEAYAGSEVIVEIVSVDNAAFTATFAVRNTVANSVRYVDFSAGKGSVMMENDEEASLVVANTPGELIWYSGFALDGSPASVGLDYSFKIVSASPAH